MVKRRRDWITIAMCIVAFVAYLIMEVRNHNLHRPHHPGLALMMISWVGLFLVGERKGSKPWHLGLPVGFLILGYLIETGIDWPDALILGTIVGIGYSLGFKWYFANLERRINRDMTAKYPRTSEGESP